MNFDNYSKLIELSFNFLRQETRNYKIVYAAKVNSKFHIQTMYTIETYVHILSPYSEVYNNKICILKYGD